VARADLPERLKHALGDALQMRILATELSMLGFALFSWRARREAGTLTMHRRSGWVSVCAALLLVSVPETLGLHFLGR
jgi:hypothetical protein